MKESIANEFISGVFRTKNTCLEPPQKILTGIQAGEYRFQDRRIFELQAEGTSPQTNILFFHGGAYVNNFSLQHWEYLIKVINQTGCRIIAPDYPLAPESTYKEVFEFVDAFYLDLVDKYGTDKLIVMGDSAGGGLGLALVQKMSIRQESLPQQLILLSPWLDISMTNPEISAIDPKDPMLGLPGIKMAAEAYAGEQDLQHPLLSPLYGPVEKLCPIHLFIGTRDVLEPDCRLFYKKCQDAGVEINYVSYKKMIHDWMILPMMPEARKAIREITSIVSNE